MCKGRINGLFIHDVKIKDAATMCDTRIIDDYCHNAIQFNPGPASDEILPRADPNL